MPKPVGYEQITVLTAAVGLAAIPSGDRAYSALIQAEGTDVRFRDDGVNPTAGIGMVLKVGVVMEYDGDLADLRFIETAATAKLNISYYGV